MSFGWEERSFPLEAYYDFPIASATPEHITCIRFVGKVRTFALYRHLFVLFCYVPGIFKNDRNVPHAHFGQPTSSAMPSKNSNISHPAVGTLIDDDSLELVEVLGVGGYGVVYRAEDTSVSSPRSYAVKCLVRSQFQHTSRQRQLQIREITLHQLVGAHPNVVTLHRVVEDYNFTYIIMDYAPDHDLFTQILHSCRYLGDDYLIKHVFMQILDAVEYCHSLGIYHRDLKPENILCFDDGLRIAITDFGLATTERSSEEFRTGSIYHMSPECQGGDFAPTGTYSPMFNDIWSLGIILLNLATGRNPWKSATLSDPTFQAYLHDPLGFLPTVLPISDELNAVLVRMLDVDWRERMTLQELRLAMEDLTVFYSDGAIFEGSMARCPWESVMEIDAAAAPSSATGNGTRSEPQRDNLKSRWSADTTSEMVFARNPSETLMEDSCLWTDYSSGTTTTWAFSPRSSQSSGDSLERSDMYSGPRTPPSTSSFSLPHSSPGLPPTPDSFPRAFADKTNLPTRQKLTVDTHCVESPYRDYTRNISMSSFTTAASSIMHTAVEYDPYSSSFFLASPASPGKCPDLDQSYIDVEMEHMPSSPWGLVTDSPQYSPIKTMEDITLVNRSNAPSPDTIVWPELRGAMELPSPQPTHPRDIHNVPARPLSPTKQLLETKIGTLFQPMKLFPTHKAALHNAGPFRAGSESEAGSFSINQSTPATSMSAPSWASLSYPRATPPPRRTSPFRSMHWFLPHKLFASSE